MVFTVFLDGTVFQEILLCVTVSEEMKRDFGKVFNMADLMNPDWMAIRLSVGETRLYSFDINKI